MWSSSAVHALKKPWLHSLEGKALKTLFTEFITVFCMKSLNIWTMAKSIMAFAKDLYTMDPYFSHNSKEMPHQYPIYPFKRVWKVNSLFYNYSIYIIYVLDLRQPSSFYVITHFVFQSGLQYNYTGYMKGKDSFQI